MENIHPENSAPPRAPKAIGRPPFIPTDEHRRKVAQLNGMGFRQEQIALFLDITPKTLRKHFRKELDTSAIETNCRVLTSLFDMATSGRNVAAAIFWAKTRCGYRPDAEPFQAIEKKSNGDSACEPPELVIYNNDGEPVKFD